jgi:hypothetical protein
VFRLGAILWALSFLFLARITGQLIQYFNPVPWLPQLDAWQGSSLPYGVLLFSQLIIFALMGRISSQYTLGRVKQNPSKGKWLLSLGILYFLSMAGRLVIGFTNLSMHPWFHTFIPAIFHLVLATFVLLLAAFHMNWFSRSDQYKLDKDAKCIKN